MDKNTLNHALASAQMLSLLVPLTAAYSTATTRASALRSALDETVIDLVLHPTENELAHTGYLLQVRHALTQYLQETFVLPQLVQDVARQTYQKKSTSVWLRSSAHAADVCRTSRLQTMANQRPAGLQRPAPAAAAYNAKRGTVAKRFASLVRNAPWTELLLDIAPDTPEVFDTAMQLRRLTASHQGMQAYESRFAELAPPSQGEQSKSGVVLRVKPGVVVRKRGAAKAAAPSEPAAPADLSAVLRLTVALDTSSVIRLPEVAALLKEDTERVLPESERLDRIMQECCAPEPLPAEQAVDELLKLKVDRLLGRLAIRHSLLETEHKRLKKKRDEEALQKARAALKGLGPVLDILKKHPELLKEV